MNNTLKTLTSLALLAGTAQLAHAHAGFKDQITEGTVKTWNAVTITHGCNTNVGGEGNGQPHKDVIALSAIFPNSPNFTDVIIRGSKGRTFWYLFAISWRHNDGCNYVCSGTTCSK